MKQVNFSTVVALVCFGLSPAFAIERGREGGRSEDRQSPGGEWGEKSHQGGYNHRNYGQPGSEQERAGRNERTGEYGAKSAEQSGATGKSAAVAHSEFGSPTTSQSHDAATGAAYSKRNQSQYSGAEGATAGAAAANRNQPQYSGKQGSAAGAAVANRNQPKYSGAQGAAAGAAVANGNQPQYSGAQGAAAGAALANANQPQLSGAQGAAIGAAAANQNPTQTSAAQGAIVGAATADQNPTANSAAQDGVLAAAAANQNAPSEAGAQAAGTDASAATPNSPLGPAVAAPSAGSIAARTTFKNYKLFSDEWNSQNPDAWKVSHWVAGNAWSPTTWQTVSTFYGTHAAPVWYDYGDNITYKNGNIIMNGQSVGTAEQFSQQAADLADIGAANEPTDSTWLPLGVFAMVRNEQQHPHLIMQFAVNRQGMLRGNYTDEVTENTQPIRGAVDQNTRRAAWIVGNHKTMVMEAGLSNLSEGDAPALIHKSGKTDHWLLVRLQQPAASAAAAGMAPPSR